jgi:hypothetical protein
MSIALDERTLLAVAEAIKSEAGVIQHRIIKPSNEELIKLLAAAKTDPDRDAVMREQGFYGYA